jgi:hypothetical protein
LTLQTIGSFFGWSGKIFLPCAGREVEVRVKKQNAEKCYTWWVCYDINGNEVGEAVTPMLFDFTSCSPIVIRLRGFAARTQCQVGTCPFGGYEITVTTWCKTFHAEDVVKVIRNATAGTTCGLNAACAGSGSTTQSTAASLASRQNLHRLRKHRSRVSTTNGQTPFPPLGWSNWT